MVQKEIKDPGSVVANNIDGPSIELRELELTQDPTYNSASFFSLPGFLDATLQ